jgi:BTB/POZ domain
LKDPPDVTVEAEFTIKTAFRSSYVPLNYTFTTTSVFGHPNFIEREEMMNAVPSVVLQPDGSLIIDVDLQVYHTKPVWYPKRDDNLTMSLMEDFLSSSSHCTNDVTVKVGDVAFCLHRHVLAKRAPALFDMIAKHDTTSQTVHRMDDVDAGTFRSIYGYMYTGNWSPKSSLDDGADEAVDAGVAKKTLILADRYGCTGLKLLVESVMVDQVLNTSNAMEMLLLGDSLHCALLKEAAIAEILESKDAVRSLPGWELLKESNLLIEELLDKARGTHSDETEATAGLSVGELRDQLLTHDGAAVDGSREVLVQRLLAITAATAVAVVVA